MGQEQNFRKKIAMLLLPTVVAVMNILIMVYPRESLAAAQSGLALWAGSVLPGALPFVIGANILMSLGAVNFLGTALEPLMKWAFKMPGAAGFALAIGLVSGYPIGAKIVCEMRLRGELSRPQAQRLISFANNAGPLFILGAVAAGMFSSRALGYFLLAVHYGGALAVGLLMRLFSSKDNGKENFNSQFPLHIRAVRAMEAARRKDAQSFGQIFGQSVSKAVETMLLIGGFIVLFSVVSTILQLTGAFNLLPFPQDLQNGFFAGMIEMTGGVGILSRQGISRGVVALTSGLLGFGGASILFQSINFIGKTDINASLFVVAKAAHGLFSAILAALSYPLFAGFLKNEVVNTYAPSAATKLVHSSAFFAMAIIALLALSIAIILYKTLKK